MHLQDGMYLQHCWLSCLCYIMPTLLPLSTLTMLVALQMFVQPPVTASSGASTLTATARTTFNSQLKLVIDQSGSSPLEPQPSGKSLTPTLTMADSYVSCPSPGKKPRQGSLAAACATPKAGKGRTSVVSLR